MTREREPAPNRARTPSARCAWSSPPTTTTTAVRFYRDVLGLPERAVLLVAGWPGRDPRGRSGDPRDRRSGAGRVHRPGRGRATGRRPRPGRLRGRRFRGARARLAAGGADGRRAGDADAVGDDERAPRRPGRAPPDAVLGCASRQGDQPPETEPDPEDVSTRRSRTTRSDVASIELGAQVPIAAAQATTSTRSLKSGVWSLAGRGRAALRRARFGRRGLEVEQRWPRARRPGRRRAPSSSTRPSGLDVRFTVSPIDGPRPSRRATSPGHRDARHLRFDGRRTGGPA